MAQVRKTITHSVTDGYTSSMDLMSQTPGNYSSDNYFVKGLQDKIDADWNYRPNRALIQYEKDWGLQTYSDIDVVLQSVLSEKGTAISDDTRNLVFKNINENRFKIGSRFKFSLDVGNFSAPKDTWITINMSHPKLTASAVVQRCNGTLKSTYLENGVSKIHTEPVIQGMDLSSVSMQYNDTIVSPQSQLVVIAQHNEFTSKYFINERFIVGYDKVYKVKAINKFYGNSTDDPHDVGVMKLYLELTESSVYDDFDTRLAYQMTPEVILNKEETVGDYSISIKTPTPVPTSLSASTIEFTPVVVDSEGNELPDISITTSVSLENLPTTVPLDRYVEFNELEDNKFSLKKVRVYTIGDLIVKCSAENPISGDTFSMSFNLVMRLPIE